jgi:hypothetical protein
VGNSLPDVDVRIEIIVEAQNQSEDNTLIDVMNAKQGLGNLTVPGPDPKGLPISQSPEQLMQWALSTLYGYVPAHLSEELGRVNENHVQAVHLNSQYLQLYFPF